MHFLGGRPLAEHVELIAGPALGRARPGLGPGQTDTVSSGYFWDCDPPLGSQNHKIAT